VGKFTILAGGSDLMKAKLTVIIPCKNERRNIRPCIEAARLVADEILIADSGSTDGTLDIVREMGDCRIIEREYVTPSDFKNWAIPQALHDWVLVVDADERVTPELANEINQSLAAPDPKVDGYWIGRKNFYLGYPISHCGWDRDDVLRLFRRDKTRYRPRWVHEGINVSNLSVRRLRNPFLHYTVWNTSNYLTKLDWYAALGVRNFIDEQREPGLVAMFLCAPVRFLQLYFLRLGFLDGVPGFQICMITAFYSFLKKAKLWELRHAHAQPDPEAERDARAQVISIHPNGRATEQSPTVEPRRRIAA
jgi:glycosyltransferase involved in cell wall biosynthesis